MRNSRRIRLALIMVSLAGCVKGVKPYEPDNKKGRTLFMPSYQASAPAPVYARTRWVQLPEVLPARENDEGRGFSSYEDAPSLRPVYQLRIKNGTLEEAARVLGAMARYSSYTTPSLATRKVSFQELGTIDELAEIIEDKERIKVVVDHDNKEVRFLVRTVTEPTLYNSE